MNKQLLLILIMLMFIAPSVWGQKKSDIEKGLEKIGLQNVAEEIPGIEVYMVYATPYNFMGRVLYEDLDEAYLVPDTLLNVVEAAMDTLWGESLPRQSVGEQSLFYIDRYGYNRLTTILPSLQLPQFVTLPQDNYRIELPPYGSDAIITETNAAFYADIINRYEPCKVELRGDELYRDGYKITTYRFTQPYYWVLCDNRTASTDSRHFGVLPHNHVIGRCGMIVFSIDAQRRGFDSWRVERFFQHCKL